MHRIPRSVGCFVGTMPWYDSPWPCRMDLSLIAFSFQQGSRSSPSADGRLFHRAVVFTARPMLIRITLLATRQKAASLEGPQGRMAGPALQAGCIVAKSRLSVFASSPPMRKPSSPRRSANVVTNLRLR